MDEESGLLHRRDVLRAGVGTVALSTVGAAQSAASTSASARATETASTTETAGTNATAIADAAAYAPRGQVDIDDAAEAVVTPDGETAFVAVGSGFASVDVSNPANPTILATEAGLQSPDGEGVQGVLDVKYEDDRVLVPTAAQGGGPRGFYLFDVSDPANPTQVGDWFETPTHGNHNAFLLDGVAYLTGGMKVDIVDVSSEPFERLSTWEPGDWKPNWSRPKNTVLHDLYVQGDYAYCAYWDSGVFIVDVSDPSQPEFVARAGEYTREEISELSQQAYLEPGGNAHYVTVNEDATVMAEGGESWDMDTEDDSGGPSGITFYDITDETNPTEIGTVDPPVSGNNTYRGGTWTTSHNFQLRGGKLYASWYHGGVSVHDVSDPANPKRISWWASPDERAFWTAQLAIPGEFFVASSHAVNGATPGLLTFPDASGEMDEPPASVAWSKEELDARQTTTQTTIATTTTETTEPTTTTTETTEPTTTTNDEEGTGTERDVAGDGATPGFGPIAAVGGLALGAARYLRGTRDDA